MIRFFITTYHKTKAKVMVMYTIKKVPYASLKKMKRHHDHVMTAPMDDMWEEGYILDCEFYMITSNNVACGYFALNTENTLLDFHVKKDFNSDEVFTYILEEKQVRSACVSTYDPVFYTHCMKHKKDSTINTLLYNQDSHVEIEPPFEAIDIITATDADLKAAASFFREKVDIQGDWIEPYLQKLIKNNNLILFKYKHAIIGTGGIRYSISSEHVANVGITTSIDYRRIGLASYILNTIKSICNEENYHTIGSTTLDNIGSQKTMEKCGYVNYHTIYNINF